MSEAYSAWSARAYLEQYYAPGPIPVDSVAQLDFLVRYVGGQSYGTALDFGAGPCLYTQFVAMRGYGRLTLADALPENRRELEAWVAGCEDSFDWSHYVRDALEREGKDPIEEAVIDTMAALRAKVAAIIPCDIHRDLPIDVQDGFDLVMSFYCIECIGSDFEAWRVYLRRLASLVAPGGRLILSSLQETSHYRVFEESYPATWLSDDLLRRELLELPDFKADSVVVESHGAQWDEQGFSGILLAKADRPQAVAGSRHERYAP